MTRGRSLKMETNRVPCARRLSYVFLAACVWTAGCVREKEAPRPQPPARAAPRVIEPPGTYDLEGKRREKPRPTMGALEAEPRTERPPKKPPERDKTPPTR